MINFFFKFVYDLRMLLILSANHQIQFFNGLLHLLIFINKIIQSSLFSLNLFSISYFFIV